MRATAADITRRQRHIGGQLVLYSQTVGLNVWDRIRGIDRCQIFRTIRADRPARRIVERRVEHLHDIRKRRVANQRINVVAFHAVVADSVAAAKHGPRSPGQIVGEADSGAEGPGMILRQSSRQSVLRTYDSV